MAVAVVSLDNQSLAYHASRTLSRVPVANLDSLVPDAVGLRVVGAGPICRRKWKRGLANRFPRPGISARFNRFSDFLVNNCQRFLDYRAVLHSRRPPRNQKMLAI